MIRFLASLFRACKPKSAPLRPDFYPSDPMTREDYEYKAYLDRVYPRDAWLEAPDHEHQRRATASLTQGDGHGG